MQFSPQNLLELSFFGAKLQPVEICNKRGKKHIIPCGSMFIIVEVFFFCLFFRCDVSWSKNTHRVHTRPRLPLSLGAPPPAPSALRSTATLHSAQTHCSGSGGSRRCRRSRLHRGREEKMSLVGQKQRGKQQGLLWSRYLSSRPVSAPPCCPPDFLL